MPLTLHHDTERKFLEVHVSGKLTQEDYEYFVPETEKLIRQHGPIRLLVQASDFHGWEPAALWQDLKFDAKHFGDLDRLAVVGETKWHELVTTLFRPLTAGEVRYFEQHQLDDARAWLAQ